MPNRLAEETSPYLLQHAGNPVDWYPWGDEALALARAQDKPILLSVGYSACHWCHVMAHECFEDAEVAAVMNRHFVNIKVDREERPDLDQIYQLAHTLLARRGGGWPLTMFLTPEGTPFFGGTYFPKHGRHGLPGFLALLPRIAAAYAEKRNEIAAQNTALLEALERTLPDGAGVLDREPIDAALAELEKAFDPVEGGLGRAPKFPHPAELAYCLRRHALDGGGPGLAIARLTLTKMAEGGLFDHLGGGFCRYSVDARWDIPHFEKMLYDNAALTALYTDAWQVTGEPLFARVVRDTLSWIDREMTSPDGAFYSSLDADVEHEEGRYYVWMADVVRGILSPAEYAVAAPYYGLDGKPNFEGRAWHLRVARPLAGIASELGLAPAEADERLAAARGKLLAAREQRNHPARDEKVLTAWNAMMIHGYARAARVFGERTWLARAQRALGFVRRVLWRDGRLLATWRDGTASLNAYLDDHALLLDALLELMQCEFCTDDLEFARAIADALLRRFEDPASGGFFFVSDDHERLIHRTKPGQDTATPAGNGVAARALQRLGHVTGDARYLAAAERTLQLFAEPLARQPSAHVSLLGTLDEYLQPPALAILRGAPPVLSRWQTELARTYRPATLIVAIATGARGLPAALEKPAPTGAEEVNGWVCKGVECLPVCTALDALAGVLHS